MHFFLRRLVEAHPDTIRLVHRHFPIDHEYNPFVKDAFHVGAGKLSLVAIYAGTKGNFWEANDLLFTVEQKEVKLKALLDPLGLDVIGLANALENAGLEDVLRQDIEEGLRMGITATPSYLIGEYVYVGTIPADILNKAIKQQGTSKN